MPFTLNMSPGSNGCSATHPSTYTNAPRKIHPRTKVTGTYGVAHPLGAWDPSVMAKTIRISAGMIVIAPSQSILTCFPCFSSVCRGMQKKDTTPTMPSIMDPKKKNHRHVMSCVVRPAKNIPTKKPTGANAPYRLNTRFFRGPGRYCMWLAAI